MAAEKAELERELADLNFRFGVVSGALINYIMYKDGVTMEQAKLMASRLCGMMHQAILRERAAKQ